MKSVLISARLYIAYFEKLGESIENDLAYPELKRNCDELTKEFGRNR